MVNNEKQKDQQYVIIFKGKKLLNQTSRKCYLVRKQTCISLTGEKKQQASKQVPTIIVTTTKSRQFHKQIAARAIKLEQRNVTRLLLFPLSLLCLGRIVSAGCRLHSPT
jgi:hypothetical protein